MKHLWRFAIGNLYPSSAVILMTLRLVFSFCFVWWNARRRNTRIIYAVKRFESLNVNYLFPFTCTNTMYLMLFFRRYICGMVSREHHKHFLNHFYMRDVSFISKCSKENAQQQNDWNDAFMLMNWSEKTRLLANSHVTVCNFLPRWTDTKTMFIWFGLSAGVN